MADSRRRKTQIKNEPTIDEAKARDVPVTDEKGQVLSAPGDFDQWINSLYDVGLVSESELLDYYESFRYVGFDRMEALRNLFTLVPDRQIATQLVILCALRGPQAASVVKLKNGLTPINMRIPASGAKGKHNLTCQRITAATADLAAFYLKKLNVPKRLSSLECPGWLQFPSAGSIKMPDNYRRMHLEFARVFSPVIGGEFNEQIYAIMVNNSYYDVRLNLFG
jgi:hypothetical protein